MPRIKQSHTVKKQLKKTELKLATTDTRSAAGTEEDKKKRKWRPGTVALRDIRRIQKSSDNLLPKTRFRKIVRHYARPFVTNTSGDVRWQEEALDALQSATESYAVELLDYANTIDITFGRTTLDKKGLDMAIFGRTGRRLSDFKNTEPEETGQTSLVSQVLG